MAAEEARAAVWAGTEELSWAMSMEHPTATPMECWLEPVKVSSSDRQTVRPRATRMGPLKACSKVPPTGKPKVLATERRMVCPRATRRGPLKACSKVPPKGKPKVLVTEHTTVPWKVGQMGSSTAELTGTQRVLLTDWMRGFPMAHAEGMEVETRSVRHNQSNHHRNYTRQKKS